MPIITVLNKNEVDLVENRFHLKHCYQKCNESEPAKMNNESSNSIAQKQFIWERLLQKMKSQEMTWKKMINKKIILSARNYYKNIESQTKLLFRAEWTGLEKLYKPVQ